MRPTTLVLILTIAFACTQFLTSLAAASPQFQQLRYTVQQRGSLRIKDVEPSLKIEAAVLLSSGLLAAFAIVAIFLNQSRQRLLRFGWLVQAAVFLALAVYHPFQISQYHGQAMWAYQSWWMPKTLGLLSTALIAATMVAMLSSASADPHSDPASDKGEK